MKFLVATSSVALLAHQVSAHGYLSQPKAYFPNGINTAYNALLTESSDPAFSGLKWNDSPEANTAMFTKSFPNSQFKTLRALMDTAAPDCGNTALTGDPVDVSSLSSMTWQNDQERVGLIASHHGPCEGWIDDTRVFHSDDCRADYTGYPAEIPVDYSSCSGDCTFTFYWLALHEPNWQVYKQCAPIVNGSGGAKTATTEAPSTSQTEAPSTMQTEDPSTTTAPSTTEAPASTDPVTTDAPASDSEYTSSPSTTSSAAGTVAPADVTDAPAATTATHCKTRRRNLRSKN